MNLYGSGIDVHIYPHCFSYGKDSKDIVKGTCFS